MGHALLETNQVATTSEPIIESPFKSSPESKGTEGQNGLLRIGDPEEALRQKPSSPTLPEVEEREERSGTEPVLRAYDSKTTPYQLRTTYAPQERYIPLKKWEGMVLRVDQESESFWARLIDLNDESAPELEAEFPMEEVSPSDMPLLGDGAVFYWNIGYTESRGGTRRRTSSLRFRRLPAWTEKDLAVTRAKAKTRYQELGWGDDEPA